jgi:excisionase family DNA binding protein
MHCDNLWGYPELCQYLRIKPGTAYSWVSRNTIPYLRISGRCVRFEPDAIKDWATSRAVSTHGSAGITKSLKYKLRMEEGND